MANQDAGPALTPKLYWPMCSAWTFAELTRPGDRKPAYCARPMQPLATLSGAENISWKTKRKLSQRPQRPGNILPR